MWTPPERIKHQPDPGAQPNADEAASARLFSPVQIGSLELKQRTWVPAMVPWRASDEGLVTDNVLGWYERFAKGRPGAIVVEATGVRDVPSGPLLRIGHDRFIPGLQELVDTVHRASDGQTKLLIQIIDFLSIRKRPDPSVFLQRFLKITDRHRKLLAGENLPEEQIREQLLAMSETELADVLDTREQEAMNIGYRERVTDMDLPHVRDLPAMLPDLFGQAAGRAQQAGFDGVELHYAHAYTMASFLSRTNTRPDQYGGSLENRARLPLEVFRRTRDIVGPDYALGCRFLAEECVDGGSDLDDAIYFGVEFARTGMDFLSLSRGGKFDDAKQPKVGAAVYPYTGPSGYECMPSAFSDAQGPFGRNISPTSKIRAAVRAAGYEIPIVVSGGIHSFEVAEDILQNGDADIVGSARQALADPDWFLKVHEGRGGEVRQCTYSNYCEGLDQKHKEVTCKLWDRLDLEQSTGPRTKDGKRRAVAP